MSPLPAGATALARCPVCNRRTWIRATGVVARHKDGGGRHDCPLSGRECSPNIVQAVTRHPSTPPPVAS